MTNSDSVENRRANCEKGEMDGQQHNRIKMKVRGEKMKIGLQKCDDWKKKEKTKWEFIICRSL